MSRTRSNVSWRRWSGFESSAAQHGYLLAAEERISNGISTVLRTSDGGTTWEVTGSLPGLGSMFAVSDSLTLWAGSQPVAGGVGHPLLDVSRDGGRTWSEAQLPGIAGKLGGIAVHIGARIAAQAGPGEILVSATVHDLVAGAGIAFADLGTAELKGLPGTLPHYAATGADGGDQ